MCASSPVAWLSMTAWSRSAEDAPEPSQGTVTSSLFMTSDATRAAGQPTGSFGPRSTGRSGSVLRPALRHERGRLGAAGEAELVQDAAHVVLHRLLGEEERGPDLAVGLPFGEVPEDLALLIRERRDRRILVATLADALAHLAGHGGVEQ